MLIGCKSGEISPCHLSPLLLKPPIDRVFRHGQILQGTLHYLLRVGGALQGYPAPPRRLRVHPQSFPQRSGEDLYCKLMAFEKQYSDQEEIEYAIVLMVANPPPCSELSSLRSRCFAIATEKEI